MASSSQAHRTLVITTAAAVLLQACQDRQARQHAPATAKADTGFSDQIYQASMHDFRTKLDEQLFDYPSARFRNIAVGYNIGSDGHRHYVVCGAVNAKNKFSAYSGWSPFYIVGDDTSFGQDKADLMLWEDICGHPPKSGWIYGRLRDLTYRPGEDG